ncbi:enoyl-CoA hydratase/isomerase family protein [Sphingosinicella rhizophila]|uniref:Enoyl-CoA hydratase/isomerase family protein n=1 Tax=Sphingosinicella rhizophila TaxID=3050082 RepID=A0ABU3Q382_9SPHN|nr:enoyl-CoA hydratase/isomerase family protein [Sphingosinicella sp. GR2756]MDT9597529.1 enoyl-CoA hydratase/isomerase family protein [Sphingosinicella sp. GR2756]
MFHLSIDSGLAHLRLNRPEARNAIAISQWSSLSTALDKAERSGARILVVAGDDNAFCAGADLSDFELLRDDAEERTRFRLAMREALARLRSIPIPTIAVIDGACFGAGVALAMACDFRIAATTATFGLPPAKLGLSYPQEDVRALVSLVGPGQAARLLFEGATIDGAEAERIGLVEQLTGSNLAETAAAFAARILANSSISLAALKRGIRLAADGAAADDIQDQLFESAFASEDLAERLSRRKKPSEQG